MSKDQKLREFILNHSKDWEEILRNPPYSLSIKKDKNYVMFNYNQLCSDFSLPEVQEARGIIFDIRTWKCVCRAFDKFGNYGESYVKELDWKNGVSVQCKVDGSLLKGWNDGVWHLSTNGSIDAFVTPTGDVRCSTFGQLFLEAIKPKGYSSFDEFADKNLKKDHTTMFEIVSPINRVVVPYDECTIYYLGERDMNTMQEENCREKWIASNEFPVPKIYDIKNLEDVINSAKNLPWYEEGYVCVDKDYNRCKIKSTQYIIAHYARNNNVVSNKRILEIILNHEEEEFLVYADDYKDALNNIKSKMADFKILNETELQKVDLSKPKNEIARFIKQNCNKCTNNFIFACKDHYDRNEKYTWEDHIFTWDKFKWERELKL